MGHIRAARICPGFAVATAKTYSYLAMLVGVFAVVGQLGIRDPGGLSQLVVFDRAVHAPFWYSQSAFSESLGIAPCVDLYCDCTRATYVSISSGNTGYPEVLTICSL